MAMPNAINRKATMIKKSIQGGFMQWRVRVLPAEN
jgi:hypothetical protein